MAKRITQEEWDRRANAVSLVWLGNVNRNDEAAPARCQVCSETFLKLPNAVAKGRGCPHCSREQSRVSDKKWREFASQLEFEWVAATPQKLDDTTKDAKCLKCGDIWTVSPRALYRGRGHPYCPSSKRGNSQRVSFAEWQSRAKKAGLVFLEEPLNSKTKTPARCLSCQYEWRPTPINISSLGSGCPRCGVAKATTTRKENSSLSNSERKQLLEEAARAAGLAWLDLEQAVKGGQSAARCLNCSHKWSPWVSNVVGKQTSCPKCAGNLRVAQEEWQKRAKSVGVTLLSWVGGRHADAIGRCDTCNKVSKFNAGTISFGHGCPVCGQLKSSTQRIVPHKEWQDRAKKLDLHWLEPTATNREHKAIRCLKCNYEWKIAPSSMSGCPRCSKRVVTAEDWNRRAAAVSARWLENPLGARKKALAECLSCGKTWSTTPDSISHGSGCPNCAETGFNPAKESYLYLIQDSERGCRKLGISNLDEDKTRLNVHKRNGFKELIFYLEHSSGSLVANIEEMTLAWIRLDHGLPQFLDKKDMPQRGWTETFSLDGPSNSEIVDHIIAIAESLIAATET